MKGSYNFAKRKKELARQQRQQEKAARKAARKANPDGVLEEDAEPPLTEGDAAATPGGPGPDESPGNGNDPGAAR